MIDAGVMELGSFDPRRSDWNTTVERIFRSMLRASCQEQEVRIVHSLLW
jgi:hypothetical protein